jgi:Outer membrane receptor proteins, mostly Fe transport
MTLDVGASYIIQKDRNMTNQGTYSNPLVTAYLFPRGDDWNDIRMFERYDTQRKIYVQYWPQEINEFTGQNPYWINYRNLRENNKERYMLNANLSYKILDWLNVAGRIRIDNSFNTYTEKLYASSNTTLTEGSRNGLYGIGTTKDKQTYGDLMLNMNKNFGESMSLQANIGGSISDMQEDVLQNRGPLREDLFSNMFNVYQLDNTKTKRSQSGYHDQTKSLFTSIELGYKSAYYLTLTGRNDWPSQLAGPNSVKKSFFYPSVGTSFILSQIFSMPKWISLMKVRASFASVGLPFPRFLANPTYEWDNSLQDWKNKSNYPLYNLKPEKTDSWEVGFTTHFSNHFNFDLSFYNTRTYNQTFNPQISVSSKYDKLYIQTGSVRNIGTELALGYKNNWGKFGWSTNYTFSTNKNKIIELVKNYVHPETGAIINKNRLDVGGLSQAHFILKEGGTLGDLYSLSDLKRDSNGYIYINANGEVTTNNQVGDIKLGSVFPKCNMAWRNDFSYKNFTLGFMISARIGGIVYSATQAALDLYGVSETSALARDKGAVLVNGGDMVNPEKWYSAIGAKNGIPQFYTYSASNVRLQEANVSYTIPKKTLQNIADVTISLVARNLWMIYCKAPFDPETTATTGNYYQGIDNFMMPNTRNIGFNVRLKF